MEATRPIAISDQQSAPQNWRVLATLSALMGFASISTDFYLPAMPEMALSLRTGAGELAWTVSAYLIGFSLGQLLWGPIGDKIGRRLPVALGLGLFIIGSAGCAMADSVWAVIGWRVVQAIGASAGVVLGRAMVRDLYSGARSAQMLSTLIAIMGIAPLVGPLIGGQVLLLAGWRAIFWTLVAVGLATLGALLALPETLPEHRRSTLLLSRALSRYVELLKHRRLLAYAGAGGFFYAGMFAYIAGTPFAYITYHHLAARAYGVIFAAGVAGIMATNILNSRLVERLGGDRILLLGAAGATITGLVLAVTASTDWGGLAGLVVPLFFFTAMTGFIVANSIAGALADFSEQAGAVSALVGALQYGSGIVGAGLVGFFANGTPAPMGVIIGLSGFGTLLCALPLTSQISKHNERNPS